jgi:hypothetical protein
MRSTFRVNTFPVKQRQRRRHCSPPALSQAIRLAPVSFHPDIAATAMCPVAFDPARMRMWRFFIPSRNPNVCVSIPALIAGMPGPVAMLRRWGRNYLALMVGWRPDTDHELRVGGNSCAYGKQSAKGKCQKFTIRHFSKFLSCSNFAGSSKPYRAKKSPCPVLPARPTSSVGWLCEAAGGLKS